MENQLDLSKIDASNYHTYAVATESPAAEAIPRMCHPDILRHVEDLLTSSIELAKQFDTLKRHLFYGKDLIPVHPEPVYTCGDEDIIGHLVRDERLIRLVHCFAGWQSELGEMAEILIESIFGCQPLDVVHFQEEMGDFTWYGGQACDTLNITYLQNMRQNIGKLFKRYGDKFTTFLANNRDLNGERQVLESLSGSGQILKNDLSVGYLSNTDNAQALMEEFKHVDADIDRLLSADDPTTCPSCGAMQDCTPDCPMEHPELAEHNSFREELSAAVADPKAKSSCRSAKKKQPKNIQSNEELLVPPSPILSVAGNNEVCSGCGSILDPLAGETHHPDCPNAPSN